MLVGKDFIFVGLQKTGCTFIIYELEKHLNQLTYYNSKKHGRISDGLKEFGDKKHIVGSFRDPFEMYVSLFGYGCEKKGTIYKHLSLFGFRKIIWLLSKNRFLDSLKALKLVFKNFISFSKSYKFNFLYSDVNNSNNFKNWVISVNYIKIRALMENNISNILYFDDSNSIGLLSARFLSSYCKFDFDKKGRVIKKSIEILPNFWIKNESINNDIKRLINLINPDIVYTKNSNKINTSKHNSFDFYYDQELIKFIIEKEKFIFDLLYNKNLAN